jgi:hypothetical protein
MRPGRGVTASTAAGLFTCGIKHRQIAWLELQAVPGFQ